MDKDNGIKKDPQYNSEHLRKRISTSVKRPRDKGTEAKRPQGKQFLLIPVTNSRKTQKFYENKTAMKF